MANLLQRRSVELDTEADAYTFLEQLRWGDDGPTECPHCGSDKGAWYLKPKDPGGRKSKGGSAARSQRRVWKCRENSCRRQFSVLTNTVMHATKLPVRAWVGTVFDLCSDPKGVSARDIANRWDVTPKSAFAMLTRIQDALATPEAGGAQLASNAPLWLELNTVERMVITNAEQAQIEADYRAAETTKRAAQEAAERIERDVQRALLEAETIPAPPSLSGANQTDRTTVDADNRTSRRPANTSEVPSGEHVQTLFDSVRLSVRDTKSDAEPALARPPRDADSRRKDATPPQLPGTESSTTDVPDQTKKTVKPGPESTREPRSTDNKPAPPTTAKPQPTVDKDDLQNAKPGTETGRSGARDAAAPRPDSGGEQRSRVWQKPDRKAASSPSGGAESGRVAGRDGVVPPADSSRESGRVAGRDRSRSSGDPRPKPRDEVGAQVADTTNSTAEKAPKSRVTDRPRRKRSAVESGSKPVADRPRVRTKSDGHGDANAAGPLSERPATSRSDEEPDEPRVSSDGRRRPSDARRKRRGRDAKIQKTQPVDNSQRPAGEGRRKTNPTAATNAPRAKKQRRPESPKTSEMLTTELLGTHWLDAADSGASNERPRRSEPGDEASSKPPLELGPQWALPSESDGASDRAIHEAPGGADASDTAEGDIDEK